MGFRARDQEASDRDHELRVRYGMDEHPDEAVERELDLAERYADYASLPPWSPAARMLARRELGLEDGTPAREERPPAAPRFEAGERVAHHRRDGGQEHGAVVAHDRREGQVVVAFDRGGQTVVGADELEREAA